MGRSMFVVTENDKGIRPAGPPNECFYCQQLVGSAHTDECVMLSRTVIYGVYMGDGRDGSERRIGTWTTREPASWDESMCDFARNDSTWCCDNLRDQGRYEGETLPVVAEDDGCLCETIHMRVEVMVDDVQSGAGE